MSNFSAREDWNLDFKIPYFRPVKIDVVILSLVNSPELYQMTSEAICSLHDSESQIEFQVILIESNPKWKEFGPGYGEKTKVITPQEPFNFNAYNNIGLAASNAEWVLFSNNDVLFETGWASSMLEAHRQDPRLQCLCPVDPDSPHQQSLLGKSVPAYVPGYLVRSTFTGWCFLTKRSLFEQTGPFDPRFNYYFADDDFTMVLRRHNILNAAVPSSTVRHLAHRTSKASGFDISEKFRQAQQTFHQKWGPQRLIAWKNRLTQYILRPLNWNSAIRRLYQPH